MYIFIPTNEIRVESSEVLAGGRGVGKAVSRSVVESLCLKCHSAIYNI